jgi:uncharacterized protein YbjT (DUF2867 family)
VLRELWEIEELCRTYVPATLALRLGPLMGVSTPLCALLARLDPPAYVARAPMHPVAERDVVETLRRALAGEISWGGWYELGGPEPWTLEEVAEAIRAAGPLDRAAAASGEWEPSLAELVEQRLIEPEIWTEWSGVKPSSLQEEIASWRA